MRRYERLSVSRVRENCTHGLKGGPAPFLKGLPTREEQDLPKQLLSIAPPFFSSFFFLEPSVW